MSDCSLFFEYPKRTDYKLTKGKTS